MSNSKKTLKKNKKFIQNDGAFVGLKNDYIYFLAIIRSFFKNKNFLKHFGFIYGLYFIGIFGLLIADVYHRDDIWRSQFAYPGFTESSRHLSQILTYFFHASYTTIADISPINQLIAIAFLSIASMALVKIINRHITYFGLIASLMLGLNPWYLQCISFKYDSPYMALATTCAILPFLFIKRLSLFFIVSIIFLLCMWNLYQANNGIYIVIAFFIVINSILQKVNLKQIFKFFLFSATAFLTAGLVYKFFFFIEPKSGSYIGKLSQTNKNAILDNITQLLSTINQNLGNHIVKYLFFVSVLFCAINLFKQRKTNSIIAILAIFVFLLIGIFASYGAYLSLSIFDQQPRAIAQIGGFLAIIVIIAISQKQIILNFISKCVVIYMSYCLIAISNAYANALDAQEKFIQYRMDLMLSDLESLLPLNPKEKIKLRIKSRFIPEPFRNIYSENLPLISNLTAQISIQNVYRLRHKNINTVKIECREKKDKPKKIVETRFHKIEVFGNSCYEVMYK